MNRTRVIVAVAALVWLANPLDARAQGVADPCDKNHYILNTKCSDPVNDDSPALSIATKSVVLWPNAVAADAAGNVYYVSVSAVYKVDANGVLTRFAGTGTNGYSGDGGPAELAALGMWVSGIAPDAEGNLYIADMWNNRVRKVDVHGTITTVAGNGTARPPTSWGNPLGIGLFDDATDGRSALDAQITRPSGVAIDSTGSLYVSSGLGGLRKITPDGIIWTIASSTCAWDPMSTADDCDTGVGQIAADKRGNVFFPTFRCSVHQVTPVGNELTAAGDEIAYSEDLNDDLNACPMWGDGGPANKAGLGFPSAVAVDADGNLYIAIRSHNCIRKVDVTGVIRTIAGDCAGSPQFTGVPLSAPQGVAVDPLGNVIITDPGHGRILKLAPDGTMTTIAGTMAALPSQPE
jgi:sugar lactone lactonase YvrE